LASFAWLEFPAYIIIALLWFVIQNLALAVYITIAAAVTLLPASLIFVPLRAVEKPPSYPESMGVVSVVAPIFGPVSYIIFIALTFAALGWCLYVLFTTGL